MISKLQNITKEQLLLIFELSLLVIGFIFTLIGLGLLGSNHKLCETHLWDYGLTSFIINILCIIEYGILKLYCYWYSCEITLKILFANNPMSVILFSVGNVGLIIWGILELSRDNCYDKDEVYDMCCL